MGSATREHHLTECGSVSTTQVEQRGGVWKSPLDHHPGGSIVHASSSEPPLPAPELPGLDARRATNLEVTEPAVEILPPCRASFRRRRACPVHVATMAPIDHAPPPHHPMPPVSREGEKRARRQRPWSLVAARRSGRGEKELLLARSKVHTTTRKSEHSG
jgi:hypothetical protein